MGRKFMIEDLVDYLRKKYNVPKELRAFVFDDGDQELLNTIFNKLTLKSVTIEKRGLFEYKDEYKPVGFYDGKNFKLATFFMVNDYFNSDGFGFVVFADNIDVFYKLLQEKEMRLKSGVYRIQNGMGGCFLKKIGETEPEKFITDSNIFINIKKEIKEFILNEEVYVRNNFYYKRGFLLYGKPGNGKTLLIRNLVDNLDAITILCNVENKDGVKFVSSFLQNKFYKDVLKVVILEDIDGISDYIRSDLLNLIDGISPVYKTIFIATTNFPEKLDIAISNRPSRFDSLIKIDNPDRKTRKLLLKRFFKDIPKGNMEKLLDDTKSFRGAYFKEMFLLSVIYKCDLDKAVKMMKDRFAEFTKFNKKKEDYLG